MVFAVAAMVKPPVVYQLSMLPSTCFSTILMSEAGTAPCVPALGNKLCLLAACCFCCCHCIAAILPTLQAVISRLETLTTSLSSKCLLGILLSGLLCVAESLLTLRCD